MPPAVRRSASWLQATFLFFSLTLVSPISAKDRPALSLAETVELNIVTSALMSPRGDAIAYLLKVPRALYTEKDGASWQQLHVVNFEGESRPYFSGKVRVFKHAWSPDGRYIYFVGKRSAKADHGDLFRIPLDGGEAERVYEAGSTIKAIFPSPDGRTLAFLATEPEAREKDALKDKGFKAEVYEESEPYVHVWLLDVESGEATRQDLSGSATQLSWAPDGGHYAVALAPTPLIDDEYMSRDIFVVSAKDAKIRNQLNLEGKLGDFSWSPDGRSIAWIGGEDIHDPAEGRLYMASARGGERIDLLPAYGGHVRGFHWADDERIAWLGHRGVWSETGLVTPGHDAVPGVDVTRGPIVRKISAWPGSQAAAAVADSTDHPAEVFLLRTGEAPVRLTHSNPVLEDRRLARQEVMTYTARDGLELEMLVMHPFKKKRGGNPLLMVIHGGPEAHYSNGWNVAYSRPAQTLAAQGYIVAFPNYRGSTGRGVAFSKMSQHGYGEAEFDDIVDAKRHLVEAGLADTDRTGITGGSYGGFASMWAASALSEHFAASVAFVGISDQVSKFGTTDIPREMYNVHARAWPWEDWMWLLQRSPIYYADRVKTPLLIMHGAEDPRVHPSQSMEMYRHVKVRTDTPVRLVFYPGEGHGNTRSAARYDYALRLERWMNHFLKEGGTALPPYELKHAERMKAAVKAAQKSVN